MAVGGGQFIVGIGGVVAGTGMSGTGGGAPPGAIIVLGSITLVANGGATFCHGAEQLTLELLFKRDDTPTTVIPIAPPPPKPVAPKPPPPKPKPLPIAKPAPKPTPTKTTTTTRVKGAREPTTTTTTSPSGTRTTTWVKGAPGGQPVIRNAHLAGKVHPKTKVPFDKDGYPDFRAAGVVKKEVKVKFSADRQKDFRAANEAAGLKQRPDGYTWHHHQDGTTMQLVPEAIHRATGHTGGHAGTRVILP
ncbi:MAG: HNH endonuclease [Polyangiaceae bacterium]|nr:HNH endonuclease [Polyangiaceae bacterium]